MKFNLRTFLSLILVVVIVFAVGCQQPKKEEKKEPEKKVEKKEPEKKQESKPESKEVVIYSTRHYDTDDALFKKFTDKTGIKIKVVKDKGKALIKKLESEGKDTPADLFYTADAGNLEIAKTKGLFQPIVSETLNKNIPAKLRDDENHWTAITMRARVIVYSKDRVKKEELSTYEDLADPKWKGKILVRSSSNQYNISLVSSFLDDKIMGEAKTKEWLKGFVNNLARTPKGNDRDQGKAVYTKEGDIAIMNTYYLGRMLNDKKDPQMKAAAENLGVFFPNQKTTGTHVNISGAGLIKSSKNKEAAVKFLEFLSSEEAQEQFASTNFEFPANPNVKTENELLKSFGEFKKQDINLNILGKNAKKATKLMDEAGWK